MSETVFSLPRAPGVNELWFNNSRGGRTRTKKYNAWLKEAGWEILRQRVKPILGPVRILYEITDEGGYDTDAPIKALNDLLVKQHVIEADTRRIVRELTITWMDALDGVLVTIRPTVKT